MVNAKLLLSALIGACILGGCAASQDPAATAAASAAPALQETLNTSFKAPSWLQDAIEAEYANTVAMRRHLHQNPELGNQEYQTQEYIAAFLEAQGIKVIRGTAHAPTAVIGILNEGKGRAVGFRADIDALPIKENTGLPYQSSARGLFHGEETYVSHMCGHDAHMAMLLSAAKIMAEHKDEIDRTAVFVFQPAEEGDSIVDPYSPDAPELCGGHALVEDGIIEDYGIEHMFGIHVMARQPSGKILIATGAALNSVDDFKAAIRGNQAHGAMPWSGSDALLAAAAGVVNLQQIVSRNADLSTGMGVITVGRLQAGDTSNVMTGLAQFEGTIRSNDAKIRETLLTRIPQVIENTARAYGTEADVRILEIYPVTYNDKDLAIASVQNLKALGLDAQISEWNPGASDDFAFYAQKVPSIFMFLGVDDPNAEVSYNNHSDKFVIFDEALKSGVAAYLGAVLGTP